MVTVGDNQPGRVMILNGGSSAGKTTLGRGLQSGLSDTWLLLGIDLLIWTLPPRLINDGKGLTVIEGVIVRGDLFMSLYAGRRRSDGAGVLDEATGAGRTKTSLHRPIGANDNSVSFSGARGNKDRSLSP
jgi:Chloramphenicol phosphotransferase-like protein